MATPVSATGSGASALPFSDKLNAIPRGRPIPVALTEAGLDSPTFRASAVYYSDQIEVIERWLESSVKSASKLTHDILALEDSINIYLGKFLPPTTVAENMLDQDYTILALKRVNDASRDWWHQVLHMMRRMEGSMVDPVRVFISGELKGFKDARRLLESTQKTFDQTLARYLAQNKTKEPSALREEAFAVHETRKAYLKASMDFCVQAPQVRSSLDRLMVRLCSEMVKEVKHSREASVNTDMWAHEMDRIRGWSREMEAAEPAFRRELAAIRREIGDSAIQSYKPARELESYSASTVAFLGSRGPVNMQQKPGKDGVSVPAERQGWLCLKTVSGKPTRTNWARRWFYCRDGVFGSLQQSNQGVFQGDEIGVLLCSVKPAITEERRFCFEVKTKISTMVLQAETQQQLSEWLEVFETAKKQAFETSTTKEAIPMRTGSDPAFAVRPPSVPEFSTRNIDASVPPIASYDENTLGIPGNEPALASRASFDVHGLSTPRRSITAAIGREVDDHGSSRIMSRLDMHRKNNDGPPSATFGPVGGIASLISGIPVGTPTSRGFTSVAAAYGASDTPVSNLAPLTLSSPPLVTYMSRAAVMSAIDHNAASGASHHLPAFLLANFWGSNAWSSFYADGQLDYQKEEERALALAASEEKQVRAAGPATGGHSHRKTMSAGLIQPTLMSDVESKNAMVEEGFPARYPPELRVQHASFRLLFPSVPVSEKLVLVFRATWSSTRGSGADSGDAKLTATGRVFVTPENLHFYGQRMGLLVAFSLSLDLISEITSAPGKECDFLFLHLTGRSRETRPADDESGQKEGEAGQKEKEPAKAGDTGLSRITIKSFLEDLPLLQARLNILMDNLQAEEPMKVQDIVANFVEMENTNDHPPLSPDGSSSIDSWEEVEQPPITLSLPPAARAKKEALQQRNQQQQEQQHQNQLPQDQPLPPPSPGIVRISHKSTNLSSSSRIRFNGRLLPHGPSGYEPSDMDRKVCEKHYDIGAKACFHVVFGDRSYIFARLYHDRQAANVHQGPWALADEGRMRRDFAFEADAVDMLGRKRKDKVLDYQTIDVFTDHSTYVVSHVSTSWHLPFSANFRVVTMVVITHEAKSRCKLAVYTRINWLKSPPPLSKRMVHKHAMNDAVAAAETLANAATDQVHKLGAHSRTKKAIQAYGHIGHTTQTVLFGGSDADGVSAVAPLSKSHAVNSNGRAKNAALRPRTLTQMFWDTLRSFVESVVTSLIMWIFAVLRSLFKVVTVYRALLGLLVASALLNVLMTSKEASTWWTERRAARFMQRVGVGPNVAMSRAVRWEDLSVAVGAGEPLWHESECFSSFQAVANASDPDALLDDNLSAAPPLLTTRHSQETQHRIHRTRQRLGSYRHDLLVAMRVVNRIEREMEMAEWETWVADENVRCAHLKFLLEAPSATNSTTSSEADKISQRKSALGLWYKGYCGSCKADARELAEKQGLGMNVGL
ncbi:hypothetical protein TD95_004904 [Thielaviopsis punctulata]|uniref:Uncharacterized protein n=1 Tax=Thielaviopsis punctulata TaxID=72032 RepID=A0A0F4ZI33_9PEZI|nr:hypothetical protein TD95_004904 [Thielaviopsis punctulata]